MNDAPPSHPPDASLGLEVPRPSRDFPHTWDDYKCWYKYCTLVAPQVLIDTVTCATRSGNSVSKLQTSNTMEEEVKAKVTEEVQGTPAPVSAEDNAVNTFDGIVARIAKMDNTTWYRNLKVRNVTVDTNEDGYSFVNFATDRPIKSNVAENGVWKVGEIKVVRVSIFAVAAVLKEDELTAILANDIVRQPKIAEKLLSGATITVLQRMVGAGEEYKNPFTTNSEVEPVIYDHQWFANYTTHIELGMFGKKVIDNLANAMVAQLIGM